MKNKKILIGIIIAILVIVAIVALVYLYIQNKDEEKVTTLGKIELLVVDQTNQPVIGAGVDLLVGDDVQGSVETGTDGKVNKLTISHLEVERDDVLPVDAIIVQYGITSSPSIFPVKTNKLGIEVNNFFETSLPNVYAIGNSCYYEGKVKNLTCGFGEAVIAITKIDQLLNPTKNIPVHF